VVRAVGSSGAITVTVVLKRVDGICGSGQIGTVKTWWVENAGVDISARCGKGGQCGK